MTHEFTFEPWPKIPRLKRSITITEKIDGTNAAVIISDDGLSIGAQSRTRLITPGKDTDNHGFAGWVEANRTELLKLGPGRHFGEWWGAGINKRYPGFPKTFSLFNTVQWNPNNPNLPSCCSVVPVLYQGDLSGIDDILQYLRDYGSVAAPGCNSEGIVVYHSASRSMFKVTLENDETPKGSTAE
jgi:hypothetical protein